MTSLELLRETALGRNLPFDCDSLRPGAAVRE
jgi:hypothetical protein